MLRSIKIGMLFSYDYELIKISMPLIYEYADKIVLAVDKDGKTWTGNDILIPDRFFNWVKDFDTKNKIKIYKDSFFVKELTAMQCETRERTMLAKYMGEGGWHIQIDADEYILNFKHLVDFLHYLDRKKPYINTVSMELIVLFKRTTNGFLFVKGIGDLTHFATIKPRYSVARRVIRSRAVLYPQRVIHDSWARTEEELWTKLNNWGHNNDFNIEGYFNYWKAINEKNYMFAKDVHPCSANAWQGLNYIEAKDINVLIEGLRNNDSEELLKTSKIQINKTLRKIMKLLKLLIPPIFIKLYERFKD